MKAALAGQALDLPEELLDALAAFLEEIQVREFKASSSTGLRESHGCLVTIVTTITRKTVGSTDGSGSFLWRSPATHY
jgi:hypothetical protein